MTRLAVPSGVPLAIAHRRLAPGYMQPSIVADGAVAAASLRARATATASATPHTKGGWTEIVAATTSPISVVFVSVTASTFLTATDTSVLLDIGIGVGGGSYEVCVPNLALGWRNINVAGVPVEFMIPVNIPVGSQIGIRCQGTEVSKVVAVQLVFGQLANYRGAPRKVVDLGTVLGASRGTILATPASVNTKGAWTPIGTTTQPCAALGVGFQGGSDLTQGTMTALLDIGFGTSSVTVLAPDLPLAGTGGELFYWLGVVPTIPCMPVLPAGIDLSARWATTNTGSTIDVILYEMPFAA